MFEKIRVGLRRFIARNLSFLVDIIYKAKIKLNTFNLPPIIILTPGKVGSSSVYNTLKKNLDNPIYHIHRLSKDGIKKSEVEHLESDRNSRPLHLIVSKHLREKLKSYEKDLFIITIVREPISRFVSAFFQNTEFYKTEIEKRGLQIDKEKAYDLLMSKLDSNITDNLEDWFEKEIKGFLNIDVFSTRFKHSKGYQIFRNGKVNLLLLRLETLDDNFSTAIQDFLNLEQSFELINVNIGGDKHYSDSYKKVKNEITLSEGKIDRIINSKYFHHFYFEEANVVKERWIS